MTTLTCPKCTADMRSYERNLVLVDQCTGCGGLFLDRGELEKLVTAENEWHGAPAAAAAVPTPQDRRYDDRPDSRGYDDRRHDDRGYDPRYRKKKKSFLSELFDD
ncbi:MAG: zf-TFIIB domain-containing protein [Lapillicoccus sp.]